MKITEGSHAIRSSNSGIKTPSILLVVSKDSKMSIYKLNSTKTSGMQSKQISFIIVNHWCNKNKLSDVVILQIYK
jgi:hypothetical protein